MALSKEEKKAKKEAKRLEKLAAAAEARKKSKREELQREMTAQALKKGELDKTWREMMLKIQEPLFRKDIEIMWHVFERAYDKKDYLINHTMRLMDVADDQFQRTVASFCDTIDTMINKFLADFEALSEDNNKRTAELLKRGEDDTSRIMTDHSAAETHLQLLLYHAHASSNALAWTTRGETMVKEDEEKLKYANERDNLRSLLEKNYNSKWDEYKGVLKAYVVNIAENQKKVRKLRRKENLIADIIASQDKKIANSDGLLKHLRAELGAYESGTKQAVFRDRRNRHRDACFRLKKSMCGGVASDMKKLALLVKSSDESVEWLEAAYKKGDRILRMAALCRKFETQREKVLPYGSLLPESPTEANTSVRQKHSEDSLVTNAISTTCGLTRLWQRTSKVELMKRALLREKMFLEQENAAIASIIQSYKEDKISPDTFKCICASSKKNPIIQPVAVEGVLEMKKFIRKNSK